jgi:hypothetical protein
VTVISFLGVPLESATDCGSETTQLFGLANAIRYGYFPLKSMAVLIISNSDISHPDFEGLPAHRYLRSVHNIAIERLWLRLKLDFGNNAEFERGVADGLYDSEDSEQL